ncbi:MAG: ABC transporter ATP-binding protein/permease, partial [Lachnospiraceae bacterium]|nr:ABC transporter ATP-binding protein/permease [Lachnospiraceae bacterium]
GKYRAQERLGGVFLEAVRTDLFRAMEKADYESLLQIGKDKLKHILYSDVLDVFRIVGNYVGYILLNVVLLISFLVVSAWINPVLAVFLLVAAILGFAISWFTRKKIIKLSSSVNGKMKEDNAQLNQFVDSIELVKTHSLTDYFVEKQKNSLWNFINTSIKTDAAVTGLSTLSSNYYQLVYLAIAAYLSMTMTGNDAGSLAFFLFATQKVISFSNNLETAIYMVLRMAPSFGNVERLLNAEVQDGETEIDGIESMEFQDVSFAYGEDKEYFIKNQSQRFERGDVVRLTGANGSGKSTYVKLLVNLLKPKEGKFTINGLPAEQIKRESLYKHIVYISQDEVLLNDDGKTYLEKITGKTLTDEKYHELLAEVKLSGDIPAIEMGGKNLSGGQRKKLMLINLLLRWEDASVIILDEVENALDADTRNFANALIDLIYQHREDHIIFRISHLDGEETGANKFIQL